MIFEVGQVWKTKGGWPARIVAIIKSDRPVVAVHYPDREMDEHAEQHESDGSFFKHFNNPSSWDLMELTRESE